MWLQQKASLTQRAVDKALPKLHNEDVYDLDGLHALHSLDSLGDVFSRVVALQVANALDKLTISNQEPAGLTTPRPRAATMAAVPGTAVRGIDFDAAPHSQQPEAAAENDREPASLPEPTRSGGEGGSLGEEVEQAVPPTTQCNRNWEMPPNPPTASSENIRSSAPTGPSLAGAPATSPPAVDFQPPISFLELNADALELLELAKVDMQIWHKELQVDMQMWQQRHLTQKRWTTPPGPMPGSELPLEWRYSEREWRALELYDRWLCGEALTTEQEGRYEDDLDCGEIEVKGLREAELVNHILAAALRYNLSIGDGDALLGEVEMRTGDGTSAGTAKIKAVDARYPAASPGNVMAFAMHGASGAIACPALCAGKVDEHPLLGATQSNPPSPAEAMQLMVKAARAELDKQRGLDERAGRGFVRYPARAGEPERSGRRCYDDGSAGDAAKYDDAHTDDDDHGGDDDDDMSDFSGNNSDGQSGA